MKLHSKLPYRRTICGLVLLAVSASADDGLVAEYCSSLNTGSADGPFFNIYNSLGECSTKCQDKYAFGVVQGQNCWCSNYIPGDQSSVQACSSKCPGYPYELCGDSDQGLYGYIALNRQPLGTMGASNSKSSSEGPPDGPTREVSETVFETVTEKQTPSPNVVVSLVTPPPISASSYMPSSSSTPPPEKTTTKAVVSTRVTTISGDAVTQTVTTTPISMAPNNESSHSPTLDSKGLSGGAIAGAAVGTLAGTALIAGAAFFFWRRRRDSEAEEGAPSRSSPKRKGSVLSRAGLLGGGGRPQSMSENTYDDGYFGDSVTRPNSVRHSTMFGSGVAAAGVAATGPLGSSDAGSNEQRHSKPLVYDQRLNPSSLFVHHDNGSRASMQDQEDYSRPLAIANPSYTRSYSFDSR